MSSRPLMHCVLPPYVTGTAYRVSLLGSPLPLNYNSNLLHFFFIFSTKSQYVAQVGPGLTTKKATGKPNMLEEKGNKVNNKQEKDVVKKEERNRNRRRDTEKKTGIQAAGQNQDQLVWTEYPLYVGVCLKENPRMSSFNDKNESIQLSRFVLNNCWSGSGILQSPF